MRVKFALVFQASTVSKPDRPRQESEAQIMSQSRAGVDGNGGFGSNWAEEMWLLELVTLVSFAELQAEWKSGVVQWGVWCGPGYSGRGAAACVKVPPGQDCCHTRLSRWLLYRPHACHTTFLLLLYNTALLLLPIAQWYSMLTLSPVATFT